MLCDEGIEDPDIRAISSKVDLHRLEGRSLWILSHAIVELDEEFEFIDHKGHRVCLGRFGQLCISSKCW